MAIQSLERQFRLHEASQLSGYSVAALRKKIRNRELGYRKTGRIITVSMSDLEHLLGKHHLPLSLQERAS